VIRAVVGSVLATLQLGCVGLVVGTFDESEIGGTGFELHADRHWAFQVPQERRYTKVEIIGIWGEPREATRHQDCEVLVYRDGLSWSGLWAYVLFVPVPIGVPTSTSEIRIYLREDRSVGIVAEGTANDFSFGFMCGELICGFLGGRVNAFTALENPPKRAKVAWCE